MRQAIAALGLIVALTACTVTTRTGYFGDDIPGSAAARAIDTEIGSTLHTIPGAVVGHATCPAHLDASQGKIAYCTLPVDESTVRIAVTGANEYGKFFVKLADPVLDMRDIERKQRALLADQYDLHADVRCGSPHVRAVAAGTTFTCALFGRGLPADHVDIKVTDSAGHLHIVKPHGARSATMSAMMPYLRNHDSGAPTVVPGRLLARYVPTMMHQFASGDTERLMPLGAATCPAKVDLSGTRRGVCRQHVGTVEVRVAVWIDRATGLGIATLDYALSTRKIADNAVQLYRNKFAAAGQPQMVAADCGPDRIIVAESSRPIICTLTYGTTTQTMTVHPLGDQGMRIDLSDRTVTPAPR